ncbi:unnamed protein product, partial [Mesorhabditis spiculigera]
MTFGSIDHPRPEPHQAIFRCQYPEKVICPGDGAHLYAIEGDEVYLIVQSTGGTAAARYRHYRIWCKNFRRSTPWERIFEFVAGEAHLPVFNYKLGRTFLLVNTIEGKWELLSVGREGDLKKWELLNSEMLNISKDRFGISHCTPKDEPRFYVFTHDAEKGYPSHLWELVPVTRGKCRLILATYQPKLRSGLLDAVVIGGGIKWLLIPHRSPAVYVGNLKDGRFRVYHVADTREFQLPLEYLQEAKMEIYSVGDLIFGCLRIGNELHIYRLYFNTLFRTINLRKVAETTGWMLHAQIRPAPPFCANREYLAIDGGHEVTIFTMVLKPNPGSWIRRAIRRIRANLIKWFLPFKRDRAECCGK